jgi:hypothetical protein
MLTQNRSKCQNYENLRKKSEVNLHDFGFYKGFLNMMPKIQATEQKVDKKDSIKGYHQESERLPSEREKNT